jgi:RNA recognition motif-containing protein
MPSVQVQRVPLDSSAEELRQLFSQFGEVRSLVLTYDGAAEGCALVSYADTAAAEQAADLLDSYPLRGSLLEVQVRWGAGIFFLMEGEDAC